MKLARQKELLRFFQWLAACPSEDFPDDLLGLMLLYALHTDSELDAEKIFHTLSSNPELEKNTMSVAEKLKAQGRQEGRQEGLTQGRLQALRANIVEVLEVRFDAVPFGLGEAMDAITDESNLRDLHRAAIQCDTLEAFAANL